MKNFIRCFVLVLSICSFSSKAVELTEKLQAEIVNDIQPSFEGLVEAAKALNTERYFTFIDSKNFVGLNADGTNLNSITDLRNLIESGFNAIEKVESLTFTNVNISVVDSNTVILVNEYEQKVRLKSGDNYTIAGGGTQVWSKTSGTWLLVSISSSLKQ